MSHIHLINTSGRMANIKESLRAHKNMRLKTVVTGKLKNNVKHPHKNKLNASIKNLRSKFKAMNDKNVKELLSAKPLKEKSAIKASNQSHNTTLNKRNSVSSSNGKIDKFEKQNFSEKKESKKSVVTLKNAQNKLTHTNKTVQRSTRLNKETTFREEQKSCQSQSPRLCDDKIQSNSLNERKKNVSLLLNNNKVNGAAPKSASLNEIKISKSVTTKINTLNGCRNEELTNGNREKDVKSSAPCDNESELKTSKNNNISIANKNTVFKEKNKNITSKHKKANGKRPSENKKEKKKFKCTECKKEFLRKADYQKHNHIHTGVKPYQCTLCDAAFRQGGNLKSHEIRHHTTLMTSNDIFVCDYCKKAFLMKETLRVHMVMHTGLKPYSCKICHMKFGRNCELHQHAKKHTGERKHECYICHTKFTTGSKLALHVKGHYGIKDQTCYMCGKSFTRRDSLKKHLACYHFDVKGFECPICKKKLKGHLREHMRTHAASRPHVCKDCGRKFAQKSQWKVHQRKHSGARPYECRVCARTFSHSTVLTLHVRKHTGEKPVRCPLCPERFTILTQMKNHMRSNHKTELPYKCKICNKFFKFHQEMTKHAAACTAKGEELSLEEAVAAQIAKAHSGVEPPMALSRMRLLLCVLLRKIASDQKLHEVGGVLYSFGLQ